MENLSKLFDRIREGDLDLKVNEDGRTTLSDQPLFELRQYISALEAGYRHLRNQVKVRQKIEAAAAKSFAERELGMPWHKIESAVGLYTAKPVECITSTPELECYGNCPTCGALIFGAKKEFCNTCGQTVYWPENDDK